MKREDQMNGAMNRTTTAALIAATILAASSCGPTCEDFDRSAHDAIDANATCEADADCQALRVFFSCVPGIECWTAVRADSDTNAISETILSSSGDRRMHGCGCTQPMCDEATPPVTCVGGRCEVGP